MLSSFGGGFVTGAAILRWSAIDYPGEKKEVA